MTDHSACSADDDGAASGEYWDVPDDTDGEYGAAGDDDACCYGSSLMLGGEVPGFTGVVISVHISVLVY